MLNILKKFFGHKAFLFLEIFGLEFLQACLTNLTEIGFILNLIQV